MKNFYLPGLFLLLTINGFSAGLNSATYFVSGRGPNHRVWQKVVSSTNALGQVSYRTNRAYIELATGLNFQQNGQWQEAKEEISPVSGGGAAAMQGQHKVFFPSDIYNGAIELVTPDGKDLRGRPLGISYFDGSNSVLIAELTNSIGQILPPGNQVIYTNAFTDFKADLVCTYRKGGFECDLVFREQPPGPEVYGLNPDTTRLQLLTEFFNPPEPEQTLGGVGRASPSAPGLADTTLKFGAMKMVRGKAFVVNDSSTSTGAIGHRTEIPVSKSWQHFQGRTFLIEEVPVGRVGPQLKSLPAAPASQSASVNSLRHRVSASRLLPPSRMVQLSTNSVRVADAAVGQRKGVVLDYVILNSDTNNFTFRSGTTYYVTGPVNISGVTTIEGGTTVKYAAGVGAKISTGAAICATDPANPAFFTAKDDDSVGQTITNSTGAPNGYYADTGFEIDSATNNLVQHLRFRYAQTALRFTDNGGYSYASSVETALGVEISHCLKGLELIGLNYVPTLAVTNGLITDVSLAFGGQYWQGSANQLTVEHCDTLALDECYCGYFYFTLTNSVLANVTNLCTWGIYVFGDHVGLYNTDNSSPPQTPAFDSDTTYVITDWPFVVGPLGNYYLTTNSPFIDVGSTTADQIGLYHYTTQTNQAVEANSVVDLGYHYLALDGSGNALDTDGDGVPDYVEDANGDGIYQSATESSNWNSRDTDSDGVSDGAEIALGRNPKVAGAVPDTGNLLKLQVLKPVP